MADRKSIYIGDGLKRALAGRPEDETMTTTINAIGDRYAEIVHRSMPRFTTAEWCCIFDALNGTLMLDRAEMLAITPVTKVGDHVKLNAADEKWGIDGSALVERLGQCTYCEAIAVVDAAERFWALDKQPDGPEPDPWRAAVAAIVGKGNVA